MGQEGFRKAGGTDAQVWTGLGYRAKGNDTYGMMMNMNMGQLAKSMLGPSALAAGFPTWATQCQWGWGWEEWGE